MAQTFGLSLLKSSHATLLYFDVCVSLSVYMYFIPKFWKINYYVLYFWRRYNTYLFNPYLRNLFASGKLDLRKQSEFVWK
jgi:hypothetical protein